VPNPSPPPELAKDVPIAAQMVENLERRIINFCKYVFSGNAKNS